MDYVQIAKDIRAAAKQCMDEEKRANRGTKYYLTHRAIEFVACDKDGRVYGGDPVFLEHSKVSGRAVKEAVEQAMADAEGLGFTSIGVTGGLDGYESFYVFTQGWDYDPWVGTWDLDYEVAGELL